MDVVDTQLKHKPRAGSNSTLFGKLPISQIQNHGILYNAAVVKIRFAPQSWSTWGRLGCIVALLCAILSFGSKAMSNICRVTYVRVVSKGLHVSICFPPQQNQQTQRAWKTHRPYNHNMSQRTSLTFWCFILGLVPLHGHSAHLRPIFGRVQAKIIRFLCMTNLNTSGEHLLLTSADGLGMKRLSKQLNTSALRCGKTVAARHRDPGEHDSMCCCHWYCIKHRLERCIVFAEFNCPQSSKSDSSK